MTLHVSGHIWCHHLPEPRWQILTNSDPEGPNGCQWAVGCLSQVIMGSLLHPVGQKTNNAVCGCLFLYQQWPLSATISPHSKITRDLNWGKSFHVGSSALKTKDENYLVYLANIHLVNFPNSNCMNQCTVDFATREVPHFVNETVPEQAIVI